MQQYIIYGAGKNGIRAYEYFKSRNMENLVYAFCDKNYQDINQIDTIQVYSYDQLKNDKIPFIVTISNEDAKKEILELLEGDGQIYYSDFMKWISEYYPDPLIRDRNIVAYCHAASGYYDRADKPKELDIFWNHESVFYKMFKQLDLSNVIELACGEGRHVPQYLDQADYITLVDILSKNLEICKNRFKEQDKISYYCNDGYDLKELKDGVYSALFTYDAMVHFELLDVYSYLKDIYRVLKSGAYALFHHSNNGDSYKNDYLTGVHGRSFMSKDIFAYLAYKSGFEIVEQQIIDWGSNQDFVKDLDCVTLVKKPEK